MQISVRLDEKTGKALERLANDTKRTKSFYVQEAIRNFLEDLEDYTDVINELKNIENTPNPKFYSVDEVANKLGVKIWK